MCLADFYIPSIRNYVWKSGIGSYVAPRPIKLSPVWLTCHRNKAYRSLIYKPNQTTHHAHLRWVIYVICVCEQFDHLPQFAGVQLSVTLWDVEWICVGVCVCVCEFVCVGFDRKKRRKYDVRLLPEIISALYDRVNIERWDAAKPSEAKANIFIHVLSWIC